MSRVIALDSGDMTTTAEVGRDLQAYIREQRPERTLIMTYGASLSYLEASLLNALRERGRPSVRVLMDAGPYENCLGEFGLRYNGVRYEVHPVAAGLGYRFHPKTYAFADERRVSVVVASANLTVPGFRRNWEVVDALSVHRDDVVAGDASDAHALRAYCAFLDRLANGAVHMTSAACDAVREMSRDVREILGGAGVGPMPEGAPRFLHSLDESILTQLLRILPKGEVRKVTAFSPYFDGGAVAVRALLESFPDARHVELVLDSTSHVAFNGRSLRAHAKRLRVFDADDPNASLRRFLHAKSLVLETERGAWVVAGSANLTKAGLCGVAAGAVPTGNVEAVTVRFVTQRSSVKRFVSAVPRVAWEDWKDADCSEMEEELEPDRDPGMLRVLDAEIEGDTVRCVVDAIAWRRLGGPQAVRAYLEDQIGRVELTPLRAVEDGTFVVLESLCRDQRLLTSDEPTLMELEVVGADVPQRGKGWLRRPVELRRSAASVSLRERLRPLRNSPTPDADTLIEVHHALCALLMRLASPDASIASTPPSPRQGRGRVVSGDAAHGGEFLDVSELLGDDPFEHSYVQGSARTLDGLRAIAEALRSHLRGAASEEQPEMGGERLGEEPSASARRGTARRPALGAAARMMRPSRRRSDTLSEDSAAKVSELSRTFASVLAATPITAERLLPILEMAEPVGSVLLAADVVRAPRNAKGGRGGEARTALLETLISWWVSLLGVEARADGSPRGWLIRAWADEALRPALHASLRDVSPDGPGGIAGLSAGLAVAWVLARHETGNDARLREAHVGLALLEDLVRSDAEATTDAVRARAKAAVSWWPEEMHVQTLIDEALTTPVPDSFPTFELLRRWERLERLDMTLESESSAGDLPAVAKALRRMIAIARRYPDAPLAVYDALTQRTSCCPDVKRPDDFPSLLSSGWPPRAECPDCGRYVGPPVVQNMLTRSVAAWWQRREAR